MNKIRDIFLDGAGIIDLIDSDFNPADSYSHPRALFYVAAVPVTVYKQLRHNGRCEAATIAKLTLPVGTRIYCGDLIRAMEYNPDGSPSEDSYYNGRTCADVMRMYSDLKLNWRSCVVHKNVRKMRANKAYVEAIYDVCLRTVNFEFNDNFTHVEAEVLREPTEGVSKHDRQFKYETGRVVVPRNKFSESYTQCDDGIHFFFNLADAIAYES